MPAQTPAGAPPAKDPPRFESGDRAPHDGTVDFAQIVATPEFKELHESRRRFVRGGMAVATAAVLGVFALYGFAPDAMGKPAIGSLTWALVLGFALVLLSFAMAVAFARASVKWDAMVSRILEKHEQSQAGTGRFQR